MKQHQISSYTEPDRYPDIFEQVSKLTGAAPNVLSFGCSNGEEVRSILKYIPGATIVGVDINSEVLNLARNRFRMDNVSFHESIPRLKFDVAFCMSVFCRWTDTENVSDCSAIYTFEEFQSGLKYVVSSLAENGLLVVYNCNFRVHDCDFFDSLSPVIGKESGFVKKFGVDNKELEDQNYPYCIFRLLKPIAI